jgi:hypothetical protein
MENTKLYNILEYFDKYEHNRLYKYINSPYFNRHEAIIHLYELIKKHIFGKRTRSLEKEKVWKKIYPGEAYDDVRFRKLASDLLKLVEGFMAQKVYEENPLHKAAYLIEAVGKHKMDRLFSTAEKTARRLSGQQLQRSASFYFYQYQIERNIYELVTHASYQRDQKTNLEKVLNNLDWFYLAEKLKYLCSIQSQQTVIAHEYKLLFIDEIIEHIEKYKEAYENIPLISIYYQIYLTQTDMENEAHYFKLIELIDRYITDFPPAEGNYIFNYTLNYSIRKVNRGKREFLREYHEVFKSSLKGEFLLDDGRLSPWHFRNGIGVALRLGEYDWVEYFIQTYSEMLPPNLRENAVSFNTATLRFYQKKYDKVIELLREIEYDDLTYNLNSKTMLLLTYYEIDEYDPLEALLESFRAYLNRHKSTIPDNRRKSFMDLIRFTRKLIRIIPGDKTALDKLKKEVDETKGIASEKWLREKIAELE